MWVIKRKFKFESRKNCSEATQLQHEVNYLEKNKTDLDSFQGDHKEFIKNNKLILKAQQRFRITLEFTIKITHNVYTDEINKTALSSNDDKRIESIYSIDTRMRKHTFGTRKDVISNKEEIKCNNVIKQCKND